MPGRCVKRVGGEILPFVVWYYLRPRRFGLLFPSAHSEGPSTEAKKQEKNKSYHSAHDNSYHDELVYGSRFGISVVVDEWCRRIAQRVRFWAC